MMHTNININFNINLSSQMPFNHHDSYIHAPLDAHEHQYQQHQLPKPHTGPVTILISTSIH
jgi:hypothetical protein